MLIIKFTQNSATCIVPRGGGCRVCCTKTRRKSPQGWCPLASQPGPLPGTPARGSPPPGRRPWPSFPRVPTARPGEPWAPAGLPPCPPSHPWSLGTQKVTSSKEEKKEGAPGVCVPLAYARNSSVSRAAEFIPWQASRVLKIALYGAN